MTGIRTALLAVAGCVALASGCGDEIGAPSRPGDVRIRDTGFSPSIISVARGGQVRWTNDGSLTHNVTLDGGLFSSGSIAPGGTAQRTFNDSGSFAYRCTIHPATMTGTVIVP
jgi:plastocyanin